MSARASASVIVLCACLAPAFGQQEEKRDEESAPVVDARDAVASPAPVCPGPRCPSRAINPESSPLAGGPVRVHQEEPPPPEKTPAPQAAAPAKPPPDWLEPLRRLWRRLLGRA